LKLRGEKAVSTKNRAATAADADASAGSAMDVAAAAAAAAALGPLWLLTLLFSVDSNPMLFQMVGKVQLNVVCVPFERELAYTCCRCYSSC
jgi:hypothetical protein